MKILLPASARVTIPMLTTKVMAAALKAQGHPSMRKHVLGKLLLALVLIAFTISTVHSVLVLFNHT